MKDLKLRGLALFVSSALLASGAEATPPTASTTFGVSGTVVTSCSVTADPLSFGSTMDVTANSAIPGTTTVHVTCTNGTSYQVGLDGGGASDTSARVMKGSNPSNTLSYGLYTDASHQTAWGNTVGTDTARNQTGSGSAQDLTVYALIPAQRSAKADSYSDTINVTVTY